MFQIYSGLFVALLVASDMLVIVASWALSFYLRFTFPLVPVTRGFPDFNSYMLLTPFMLLLWYLTFNAQNIYQGHRLNRRTDELVRILRAHGIALLVFVAFTAIISDYRYSRGVVIYFAVLSTAGLIANRIILRNFLRRIRRRGYNQRYAIVAGNSQAAREVIYKIRHTPELGIKIQGSVTPDGLALNQAYNSPEQHWMAEIKHLGSLSQLPEVIRQHSPNWVFICLSPGERAEELEGMLKNLTEHSTSILLVPDLSQFVEIGCQLEEFDGLPVLNINASPITGFNRACKRIFDIVFSLLVLILLMPVFLVIAIGVKISSPGPILYRQRRTSLHGHEFDLLKFRSMPVTAEAQTGPVWARPEDNRATKWGTFLRKTSLDEFPQFWNVLVGDMSVVGPRPERPYFVEQFKKEVPSYMLRHKAKCGITGWAQVNGWRGNTSIERRIEHDLFYIKNWSLALDLKIILMTLYRGFINKNAY